jgi:hypothetical protein
MITSSEHPTGEHEDVQGYWIHALFTPIAVIATGTVLVVQEVNKPVEAQVPNLSAGMTASASSPIMR